ncbi:sensor histidine kinase [Ferruginibacter sp. SUN106]|uniref:sensor histidine kinase n=1 Tax=Ferruginibacter sp. SUN106 TaxID=2978348 RepID=UPI003D36C7E2
MKYLIIIVLFVTLPFFVKAQQLLPDSLKKAFELANDDSSKFKTSRPIYTFYEETNRDSALMYAQFRYTIAKQHHRSIEEAYLLGQIAYQQIYLGRFSEALTNLTAAFQIAGNAKDGDTWELTPFNTPGKSRQITLSMLNHMYGHLKLITGSQESVHYFKEGRRIGMEIGNNFRVTVADMVLAMNYLMLKQADSALLYAKEGEVYGIRGGIAKYLSNIYSVMGDIYRQKGIDSLALIYYHRSLQYATAAANFSVVAGVYESLTNYYYAKNNADSMLYYAQKNIVVVKSLGAVTSFVTRDINLGKAYQILAMAYSLEKNRDSANTYLQLALIVKDSLTDIKVKRLAAFQRLTLDEQARLQDEEKKRVETETKRKTYLLIAGIVTAFIIILLIYRNNRQKQKAYRLLQKQKSETDLQKEKADAALQELKATQSQLIQSEKMASLGELTAGIAHEIQNPLNFVNNFSEVSNELIDEMNEELNKGDIEEAKAISSDIKQNLEKINHHGKRADAIVKGMLQHSQSSNGKKEPTDINKLADEYLRLAYHGLRAKDKSFNATLKTDFDESIGNINIIPQDMGRVLLNLINNAFYAVQEVSKEKSSFKNLTSLYEPAVSLSTKRAGNKVLISVTDNGNGIPQKILDKIFQPFFTTKPTGQGTGLGLSLAYDIVKAHGGELNVQTKEGEGTTFTIQLPANA